MTDKTRENENETRKGRGRKKTAQVEDAVMRELTLTVSEFERESGR